VQIAGETGGSAEPHPAPSLSSMLLLTFAGVA
jgi:hypothetical protein